MEQSLTAFCEKVIELKTSHTAFVVVTMTHHRGDAPQDTGARMIVGLDGILFGTVGGGKIEARCLTVAQEFLQSQEAVAAQSFTWNLQRDIGMSCGGEVTMFFETQILQNIWSIVIFGAGHISQELTRALLRLNCQLTVVESRDEWLKKLPESPRLKKVLKANMAEVLDEIPAHSFVTLMTMGHASDLPILLKALKEKDFPYLGVIGSDVKRIKLENELQEHGLSGERVKDFYCPMGLPIGGNTPAEIAVSIMAQLLGCRDKR